MKYENVGGISQLTGVSKRTLYHYDHIGLLKPSLRNEENGYCLYSDSDLLRLRQILLLKQLRFDLSQIKELLDSNVDLLEPLKKQLELLNQSVEVFLEIKNFLKEIIAKHNNNKSVFWEEIFRCANQYKTMTLKKYFDHTKMTSLKEIFK